MAFNYPVCTLGEHKDLGKQAIGSAIYTYITEIGTSEIPHEVPRIFYRVLLEDRLEEGKKFTFEFADYSKNTVDEIKNTLTDREYPEDGIVFIQVPRFKSLQAPINRILKTREYKQNDAINKFILSKPKAFTNGEENEFLFTFYNEDKRSAIAIGTVEQGSYPWNVIAALSSKLLPWYFKKPLTAEEFELVTSLDKGETEFIAAADAIFVHSKAASIIEDFNIKQMFIKAKEKMVEKDEQIISNAHSNMERLSKSFSDFAKQIRDASMHKMAILNSDGGLSEAFVNLMTKNSHLKIIRWENSNPVFEVGGYSLQPAHIEALEKYIDSPSYNLYRHSGASELEFEQKRNLMEAVFIDRVISIPVCSTFCFSLSENRIYTTDGNKEPTVFKQSIRNPHHKYYNCLGNNEPKMNEYLASGDYANAIIQAQGCVPFWNIGDEAVTDKFTNNDLWDMDKNIYKLPDGTMVNCREAALWLEKKEEK